MTLSNQSPTVLRSTIRNSLLALWQTQDQFTRIAKMDDYAVAYQNGFEAALLAVAQVIGVEVTKEVQSETKLIR